MAGADLTDAYCALSIKATQRKYVKFKHANSLLEYQVLPNRLAPGPRTLKKLLKPIYAEMGHIGSP